MKRCNTRTYEVGNLKNDLWPKINNYCVTRKKKKTTEITTRESLEFVWMEHVSYTLLLLLYYVILQHPGRKSQGHDGIIFANVRLWLVYL